MSPICRTIALPTPDANMLLAAGFCERWPATHEREGFAGGLRASVWLFKEKKLDANEQILLLNKGILIN
jgi:hypothetical protein